MSSADENRLFPFPLYILLLRASLHVYRVKERGKEGQPKGRKEKREREFDATKWPKKGREKRTSVRRVYKALRRDQDAEKKEEGWMGMMFQRCER